MNTFEFVSNLHSDNLEHVVVNYFDEIMILYNLIGKRSGIVVSSDGEAPTATFTLEIDTKENATKLYESLNGSSFDIYRDRYLIEMQLSKKTISTVITKII